VKWWLIGGGAIIAFFAFKTSQLIDKAKDAVRAAGYTEVRMISFYPLNPGIQYTFRAMKGTDLYYIAYNQNEDGTGTIVHEAVLNTDLHSLVG
jgi:hypothetical protein